MSTSTPPRVCRHCRSLFRGEFARCPRDGHVLEHSGEDPLIGTTLGHGRYRVLETIDEGGAGRVYDAIDQRLDRPYAIKVLFGDLAVFPDIFERFRREAQAAARMDHPNVTAVLDFGFDAEDEPAFLVMERARGESLATIVQKHGPVEEGRLREILIGVAAGLAHAHAQGILHRDLKPNNIVIEPESNRPRLVDFGVSRMANDSAQPRLTNHGMVVGTPGFLSPEVLRGLDPDERADLYGLGVSAYYAVLAALPFHGDDEQVITATLAGLDLSPLDHAPISDDLARIIRSLLAPDPADRPASASDLQARLTARGSAPTSPPLAAKAPDTPAVRPSPLAATRPSRARPDSAPPDAATPVSVPRPAAAPPAATGEVPRSRAAAGLGVAVLLALFAAVGALLYAGSGATPDDASAVGAAPHEPRDPEEEPHANGGSEIAARPGAAEVGREAPGARGGEARDDAAAATPTATAPRPTLAGDAPSGAALRVETPDAPKRPRPEETVRPSRGVGRRRPRATEASAATAGELSAAYARLGGQLDALEAKLGSAAVAGLRQRYFDVPLADALRRPERIPETLRRIRGIARDAKTLNR